MQADDNPADPSGARPQRRPASAEPHVGPEVVEDSKTPGRELPSADRESSERPTDPVDLAFFARDDIRAALVARDVGTVYRLLGRATVSQRRIAELTGQSQSEVCAIIQGRQVRDVWVLERIADGLGIPRAWLGVSYGEDRSDSESPSADKEVDEDVKRRALLAATATAAVGHVVEGLGELTELALPTDQPLPSRLGMSHVHTVRAVREQLRSVTRYYGGQADLFGAAVTLYTRWLEVPATDAVQAQLTAALAELHTEAGWCCYDSGVDSAGHLFRALRLAGDAGDAYGVANAAWHAGATLVRNGQPNEALKLFQLGQFRLSGVMAGKSTLITPRADDSRVPIVTARLSRQSATAYALLNNPTQATRCLAEAHDGWAPRDAFERGDSDLETAVIQFDLRQFDAAEQFAANAARTYGQGHRVGRTMTELLLAEIHIRAGEPQGLTLAHHAINEVKTLHSVATRRERLIPLATALETRPGNDTRELAQLARKIAATPI